MCGSGMNLYDRAGLSCRIDNPTGQARSVVEIVVVVRGDMLLTNVFFYPVREGEHRIFFQEIEVLLLDGLSADAG